MSGSQTIAAAVLVPALAVPLVLLLRTRPNLREGVTILASLVTFGLVASLAPAVLDGARPLVRVLEVVPGTPLEFRAEPLGMLFALVASGLWIVTSIYAIGYMRAHHETNQARFFACFALAIAATLALAFSGNLFTLFVCYEVLTLSTYPLVTHAGTPAAVRAGRVYLGVLVSTSILFLLSALVWTHGAAGTTEFRPGGILRGHVSPAAAPWLLALFAFGTGKAALMPFHRWLPAAMVAPTPVSALLHAVAVVKAGVFTILKVVVYVFGIDFLRETHASDWLQFVAAATLLLASFVALSKDNLKARLAYSTVSQLAYIVLGAALATAAGVIGGGMHIAMHAVSKITLFFCAGAIYVTLHKTEISSMRGIGRTMPLTMAAFFVAALGIVAVPPGGGTWSKWFLALGTLEAHQHVLLAVLMLGSLLSAGYLLPIPVRAFFAAPAAPPAGGAPTDAHDPGEGVHEAPILCLAPLLVTAALCVLLFLWPGPLHRLMEAALAG